MSKHLLVYLFSFVFCLFSSVWSQTMWTKYLENPVLNVGLSGTWEQNGVGQPFVIYEGGTYNLWYSGSFTSDDRTAQIGYATSTDGTTWDKNLGNPVFPGGGVGSWDQGVGGCSIVKFDTIFHMWYSGFNGINFRTGHATSTDGISWTRDPNNPILNIGSSGAWDDTWASFPSVIFDGSTFHMWYTGHDGTHAYIGYATSSDGSTWSKYSGNPVMDLGPSGSWDDWWTSICNVIYNGTNYEMFYSGNDYNTIRIGYATSPDGITWDKYAYNPVLDVGSAGTWDQYWVWSPCVVLNSSGYEMWYQGHPSSATARIGYAASPIIINVPTDVPTIQAGIDSASDGNIVLVEEGIYYENINFKGKAITVASHFLVDGDTSHISNTIINGSQPNNPDSGSVVYFVSGEDTNSVLKGFTITGGTGTQYTYSTNQHTGGGLFVWSGGKIENNKIIYNHLTNAGNRYTHGAGMDLATDGNAVVRNNLIAHNTIDAWWGGGAGVVMGCSDTASILFDKNVLADNIYHANGGLCAGGAYIGSGTGWHGRIIISNNLVLRNQAISTNAYNGLAGGVYVESASPEIYNNIITENITSGRGGGILVGTNANNNPGNPIIVNNTITNNQAMYGGGLYNEQVTNNPLVMNTILWGNNASNAGDEIFRQAGTVTVIYSDIAGGYAGEGNISKEPMLRGENYQLSDSSSCIGAGTLSYQFGAIIVDCPPICFMGHSRPFPTGSRPDMGACESHLFSPVVGLEPLSRDNLTTSYQLEQNYPNPFNPTTTIGFNLPKAGQVTLKIFNILGEEVVTLLSGQMLAGSYKYEWDATGLTSGIYLYKLQAGDYVEVKKMILMK